MAKLFKTPEPRQLLGVTEPASQDCEDKIKGDNLYSKLSTGLEPYYTLKLKI